MPTDPTMALRVAEVIREARLAKGWTQTHADDRIGSGRGVAQWEAARHLPQLALWACIVQALEISPERERWAIHGGEG